MSKHFISVLGTSNYEPVSYDGQSATAFVQIALLEKFQDELQEEGSKITFLLTKEAKENNWQDRPYRDREKESMEKWPEAVRPEEPEKRGLASEIAEKFPEFRKAGKIHTVDIPIGKEESELWEIFWKLYESIDENDEIIFDMTHSFRSIPLLAVSVLNYAGVMKKSSLKGIYYGAYEASKKDESGIRHAPIFDLSVFNEILQWTHAAETLERDGNPREINDIIKAPERWSHMKPQEKEAWTPVTSYISSLSVLAESLNTCRGGLVETKPGQKVKEKTARRSIHAAHQMVKAARIKKEAQEKPAGSEQVKPLYDLLEKAEESFSEFDTEQNYETGLAAVRWYIHKGMIQQGYTALAETAKTFLCFYYGLDDMDKDIREGVVNKAVTTVYSWLKSSSGKEENKQEEKDEAGTRDAICKYYRKQVQSQDQEVSEDRQEQICRIIKTLPFSYAEAVDNIGGARNDINHFGMRADSMRSDKLERNLEEYYHSIKKEIDKMLAEKKK